MNPITIPKEITKRGDLIIIPRKEYEELLKWQRFLRTFKEFIPTPNQIKELKEARQEYKKGKYISIDEFKQKLGIKGSK